MLYTNLKHLETAGEHQQFISENDQVMICCGRMGPMCIPVYGIMEMTEKEYPQVKFADMEFDNPEARVIRELGECRGFTGLPFTVYYKNGQVVKATSGIRTREEITGILDDIFNLKTSTYK